MTAEITPEYMVAFENTNSNWKKGSLKSLRIFYYHQTGDKRLLAGTQYLQSLCSVTGHRTAQQIVDELAAIQNQRQTIH